LQGLGVNAATGYPVEVNFFSQAVGTGVIRQCVSAGIFATVWAIVGGGAGKELVPAIAAKIAVCFSDTCTAVNAYGGPEQLVKALKGKKAGLF
jgi:hypothetical protein